MAKEVIEASKGQKLGGGHPIYSVMKQITDKLTLKVAMKSTLQNHLGHENINAIRKFFQFQQVESHLDRIVLAPEADRIARLRELGDKIYDEKINIDLQSTPILLNPWHPDRLVKNLLDIGTVDNPFNGQHWNIRNDYYYPFGFVLCDTGNHSQFAAKIKGERTTKITEILNVEKILSFAHFDGEHFSYDYVEGLGQINFEYLYPETEFEFYIGVLFEIGRLVSENREDIIPENIQRAVDIAD